MRKLQFVALIIVVILIGLLHFFTPGNLIFYHDTYRRLSYFPIVLGAIWFGAPGGFFLATLASLAFIPHLLLYIGEGPELYLGELTEIILYLAAGTVTGFIAGREAKLRLKYKQLSEKLENSYDRLHQETQLLLEVEEQLSTSQKFSALGQLSATLAHEIKNPLSSIKGTAEILLDEFPPGHPKREFVEILLKETTRLNSTVENVLQYSRGHRQLDDGATRTTPLTAVILQVIKLLESHLSKKNIRLTVAGEEYGRDFLVDGDKLSQVFLNLILNAIDILPPAGEIRIDIAAEPHGLEIRVSDNGPGIPDSVRGRIFSPFYSAKEGGTGLGLSISQKIVESHGGTLVLADGVAHGACFLISLPSPDNSGTRLTTLPETPVAGVGKR